MENLSGNLAQDFQVKGHGSTHKAPRRWTVLLIGDLGKIASFRLSKSLLLALSAFLAAILAVVTYSVVSYNSVHSENTQLRKDLDTLRAELETAEKTREKALVRLMMLGDSVKQAARKGGPGSARETKDVASKVTKPGPAATVNAKAKPPETPKTAATENAKVKPSETPKTVAVALPPTQAEKDKIAPPVSPAGILVKNLKIWREPGSNAFKFQFALNNIDRESGRIAGYTFIVFEPEEGSEEPIRAFPWSPLKDGKPAIFKRGQYFSIARFKFVSGTLTGVNTISRFKTATIYVHSDTGDLLVEKVFEMEKVFR